MEVCHSSLFDPVLGCIWWWVESVLLMIDVDWQEHLLRKIRKENRSFHLNLNNEFQFQTRSWAHIILPLLRNLLHSFQFIMVSGKKSFHYSCEKWTHLLTYLVLGLIMLWKRIVCKEQAYYNRSALKFKLLNLLAYSHWTIVIISLFVC